MKKEIKKDHESPAFYEKASRDKRRKKKKDGYGEKKDKKFKKYGSDW